MENHIETTENRTNAKLQKDSKKRQNEEKTQIFLKQVPPISTEITASQQIPPTLSTTKTNQTKKISTTPVSQNISISRNQNILILTESNRKFLDFIEFQST